MSWIFGLVINFPGFVVKNFDEKAKFCIRRYSEQWMAKTYTLIWFLALAFFPVVIMGALYFRVVYTLWFQRVEHSAFDCRQQVRFEWSICIFDSTCNSTVICHSLALQVSICLLSFLSSGCVESTEESHSYGGHGQCHICYVLDVWRYHLPCGFLFACLRCWWCSLRHAIHSCHVQFRYKPNCVRSGESTVQ